MKSVVLSNNRFSEKGIGQLISKREKTNLSLDVLDLSNCNLCDAALEKLAVLVVVISSELEVGPSMLNMALVMSGQGSGVAGPAVLLEKERLEMLSQREGRGPPTEREQIGSSSSSSVLEIRNYTGCLSNSLEGSGS